MARKFITLVFAALAIGCGQQNAASPQNSSAPAYVPSSDGPTQAATDRQDGAADTATDASSDLTAADERPSADENGSAASDEAMAEDEVSPGDRVTTKDEESGQSEDVADRRPEEDEPASASADDLSATPPSVQGPKISAGKLFRGLTNSVRRAANKTYSELGKQTPPPEDDPFPNGEPADADPNREN
ncbi:MAG TPA: hypothetical protein VJ783_16365 [Pirellulales bacterium]|nr:hypothetical protein [Pirellulales bacterium]